MPRKKPAEPIAPPEPLFTDDDLISLSQISKALDRIRAKVEFRLARNQRERSMLELSKINLDSTINMLRIANQVSSER